MFSLPQALNRLNAGLFSMKGEEHHAQQQLLRAALDDMRADTVDHVVTAAWQRFTENLRPFDDVPLLSEMRRMVLYTSSLLVFGDIDLELGRLIQSYFEQRRAISAAGMAPTLLQRRVLIQTGSRLDRLLRACMLAFRADAAMQTDALRGGMMGRLHATTTARAGATEGQLIAQAHTLFMSSSEPVAVSLTWILLILSQLPRLRYALRRELVEASERGDRDRPLLRAVIHEVLRLLPPNAIMVKLTTGPVQLLGHSLPPNCEILLTPFVAHRDSRDFRRADVFDPGRWYGWRPPAYAYFPFGLGARYCVGRQLALSLLVAILSSMLLRFDVVLAANQALDWKINITLVPAQEPIVRFLPAQLQHAAEGGRLRGPVADLLHY
ncbi:cytochrome P450 [Bradyrhizobium diazoefficiens]|uniref:cytochrome P450 n=1 Tax=Bradyrhizobium diazoefficiens TaxID=1355477 RepID=UPI00384D968F